MALDLANFEENGIIFEDKMLTWDTAQDVEDVVRALRSNKIVNFLKLDGNTLGVKAAEAIGEALKTHPEIRKALWKNMFTRRLKSEIPIALQHLSNGLIFAKAQLTVLDLSDNALGPNGMFGLQDLLRSPVCYSLQELLLNNCGLGIGGGQMLAEALIDCHTASVKAGTPLQLKTFITGRNRLEDDGAKAITKIFSTIKTLEVIYMPQNSITAKGMASLANGIKLNPNLKTINLNDNTMGANGASAIANALYHTPNLREINFGDCLLKDNGAYALAMVFDDINNIEDVDLGYNEIGPDGGLSLAGALSSKPHIKRVILAGNHFGIEGCKSISETIESIKPGVVIDLNNDEGLNTSDIEEDYGEMPATEEKDVNPCGGNCDDTKEWEEDRTGIDDVPADDVYEKENDITEDLDEENSQDDNDNDEEYYEEGTGYAFYKDRESFESGTKMREEAEEVEEGDDGDENGEDLTPAILFCMHRKPCSLEMFKNIQGDKISGIHNVFNMMQDDNLTLVMLFTAYKCAHLSKESSEAFTCAKQIFADVFNHAAKINQENRILKHILSHIGILKTDHTFSPSFDIVNCHHALRETLKATPFSSTTIKNALSICLNNVQIIHNKSR